MSLINNIRYFPAKRTESKEIILMCGFGGAIWQTRLLISVLNRAGYNVTAMDFPKTVLSSGDPSLLPKMINEVVTFADKQAMASTKKILLVGISLGSLVSLNILRRSTHFDRAVMITGGNIVTVAQNIYGDKIWPQTHDELSQTWHDINIFTEPNLLKDKRAIFVLPMRDNLIDTSEVLQEIERQNSAGNQLVLITRKPFGHIGTIIQETIMFPKRVLRYIDIIED